MKKIFFLIATFFIYHAVVSQTTTTKVGSLIINNAPNTNNTSDEILVRNSTSKVVEKVTKNQLFTDYNIAFPPVTQFISTQFLDNNLGTRLTPIGTTYSGFHINKSFNGNTGFTAINSDDLGNAAVSSFSAKGTGGYYSNVASLNYINNNYYVPFLRNSALLYSDKPWFVMSTNNNPIDFHTGNTYGATTSKLKINGNGQINIGVSPILDNSVTTVLGRNATGDLVSLDKSTISSQDLQLVTNNGSVTTNTITVGTPLIPFQPYQKTDIADNHFLTAYSDGAGDNLSLKYSTYGIEMNNNLGYYEIVYPYNSATPTSGTIRFPLPITPNGDEILATRDWVSTQGTSQNLQQVLTQGNYAKIPIDFNEGYGSTSVIGSQQYYIENSGSTDAINVSLAGFQNWQSIYNRFVGLRYDTGLQLRTNYNGFNGNGWIRSDNLTADIVYQLPNKLAGTYSLVTTDDIPTTTSQLTNNSDFQTSAQVTNTISGKEDISNKQTDLVASSTKYPTVDAVNTGLATKEPILASGTISQYYRGDKTWQTLDKISVGLSNIDNTSDVNKPISTATQTALGLKQDKITEFVLASNFSSTSTTRANVTGMSFSITAGKRYKIELIGDYQTGAVATGGSVGFVLISGTGTIKGYSTMATSKATSATDLTTTIRAINATNTTAGSFITSTSVSAINAPHYTYANLIFTCTTGGVFQLQFASETTTVAQLNAGTTMLITTLN